MEHSEDFSDTEYDSEDSLQIDSDDSSRSPSPLMEHASNNENGRTMLTIAAEDEDLDSPSDSDGYDDGSRSRSTSPVLEAEGGFRSQSRSLLMEHALNNENERTMLTAAAESPSDSDGYDDSSRSRSTSPVMVDCLNNDSDTNYEDNGRIILTVADEDEGLESDSDSDGSDDGFRSRSPLMERSPRSGSLLMEHSSRSRSRSRSRYPLMEHSSRSRSRSPLMERSPRSLLMDDSSRSRSHSPLMEHESDTEYDDTATEAENVDSESDFDHVDDTPILLMDQGSNTNLHYGMTPLMAAAEDGHLVMVKQFLKNKPDVNAKDDFGMTALAYAAKEGHWNVTVELLWRCKDLQVGVDPALAYAAERGHWDMVKLLLEHGANVDVPNDQGRTALMFAVKSGQKDNVELLLEHKASVDLRDKRGQLYTSSSYDDESVFVYGPYY